MAGHVLMEQHVEWDSAERRYFSASAMRLLEHTPKEVDHCGTIKTTPHGVEKLHHTAGRHPRCHIEPKISLQIRGMVQSRGTISNLTHHFNPGMPPRVWDATHAQRGPCAKRSRKLEEATPIWPALLTGRPHPPRVKFQSRALPARGKVQKHLSCGSSPAAVRTVARYQGW